MLYIWDYKLIKGEYIGFKQIMESPVNKSESRSLSYTYMVSSQEMKNKKLKDNPYSKDKFEYDGKRGCFICLQGELLLRKGEYE